MNRLVQLLLAGAGRALAENWAVLMAGSNTYSNYRHQADVHHAYQILKAHGMPEDHIILMAYDDIAGNKNNPYPGKLFNKPTPRGVEGVDVYANSKISYSGRDVTARNFYAVLTGDSETTGGKPVLQSTEDDNVFVYFADHGGVGLISAAFGPYIYAEDLNATLTEMHAKRMYGKLVFYLEACESGSMFEGILSDQLGIFATTAANAAQSSYGTYCGLQATVDGVNLGSCLGDLYSVNWMEDSDVLAHMYESSLQDQYSLVASETAGMSEVMLYGDASFSQDSVCMYQTSRPGACAATDMVVTALDKINSNGGSSEDTSSSTDKLDGAVDSRDVRLLNAMTSMDPDAVVEEVRARDAVDAMYAAIVDRLVKSDAAKADAMLRGSLGRADLGCRRGAVEGLEAACGRHSDYALKYVKTINNLCMSGYSAWDITAAANLVCGDAH